LENQKVLKETKIWIKEYRAAMQQNKRAIPSWPKCRRVDNRLGKIGTGKFANRRRQKPFFMNGKYFIIYPIFNGPNGTKIHSLNHSPISAPIL
jgi:hypothetical protein